MGGFNPVGAPNTVCYPLGLVTVGIKELPQSLQARGGRQADRNNKKECMQQRDNGEDWISLIV